MELTWKPRVHAPGESRQGLVVPLQGRTEPCYARVTPAATSSSVTISPGTFITTSHRRHAAEKKEIAAVVRRVTDHIMANGFTLVDHTGRKTRLGDLGAPELINRHPFYFRLRAQLD